MEDNKPYTQKIYNKNGRNFGILRDIALFEGFDEIMYWDRLFSERRLFFDQYREIYVDYNNRHGYSSYADKLQSEKWQRKRISIIARDNLKCCQCHKLASYSISFHIIEDEKVANIVKNLPHLKINEVNDIGGYIKIDNLYAIANPGSISLQVHHTCYRTGREPWDYSDSDLISLCPDCHKKIHQQSVIPIYNEHSYQIGRAEICDRCGGQGNITEYRKILGGVCFKCWGEGIVLNKLDGI